MKKISFLTLTVLLLTSCVTNKSFFKVAPNQEYSYYGVDLVNTSQDTLMISKKHKVVIKD